MTGARMDESWKPLHAVDVQLAGYDVSSEGRVRSWHQRGGFGLASEPILLSLRAWSLHGYPMVRLRVAGLTRKGKNVAVHSLVARAFLGPRPAHHVIDHRDGDLKNNRSTNLEYVTKAENARRAHARAKLMTSDEYRKWRTLTDVALYSGEPPPPPFRPWLYDIPITTQWTMWCEPLAGGPLPY